MRRPHFSLRSLLGLALLVAVAGYWRDLPRQNAKRFIALIAAGDYDAAEAMFGDRVGISNPPRIFQDWEVTGDGQSANDWLRGRYPLKVTAMLGRRRSDLPVTQIAMQVIAASTPSQCYLLNVEATATEITRIEPWKTTATQSTWSTLRNRLW